MTLLAADDLRALRGSVRSGLGRCWPSATSAAEGDLEAAWAIAAAQGWTAMGQVDALDATLDVVAELGRVACPLPIMDAHVAVHLLADSTHGDAVVSGQVRPLVAAVASAGSPVTASFLDCALQATHLVTIDTQAAQARWYELGGTGARTAAIVEPQPGLARPAWHRVSVQVPPVAEVGLTREAVDESLLLLRLGLVARALGAAGRAHELAVQHARERQQFGRPIGAFQAVAHRAADGALELTAARHLVQQCVQLRDAQRDQQRDQQRKGWRIQALAAAEQGMHAAVQAQFGAQHTLAAMGYFEEHEAPWLFRRVHADIVRARSVPLAAGELADRLLDADAALPAVDLTEAGASVRQRVRDLLIPWQKRGRVTADGDLPDAVELLARNGLLGLGWPAEVGGGGAEPAELLAFAEEVGYAGPPLRGVMMGVDSVAPALIRFGTPSQREQYLPRIQRGEITFGLGYSEPEAGSDLASLRTRAVKVDGGWRITGQKLWGTGIHVADYVFLAARTDPQAIPARDGISVFIVPTRAQGLTIAQHTALSDAVSCTTFYDEVFVPDAALVGERGGGWQVLLVALAAERVLMGAHVARVHRLFDDLLEHLRSEPSLAPAQSAHRAAMTRVAFRLQAARALVAAGVQATAAGDGVLLEAPMAKILTGELSEEFAASAMAMLGPAAALSEATDALLDGAVQAALRLSVMDVVAGGTNDIQRNLIARALGLPRDAGQRPARPHH